MVQILDFPLTNKTHAVQLNDSDAEELAKIALFSTIVCNVCKSCGLRLDHLATVNRDDYVHLRLTHRTIKRIDKTYVAATLVEGLELVWNDLPNMIIWLNAETM